MTVLLLPLAEMKWLMRCAADVVLAAAAAIDEVLERKDVSVLFTATVERLMLLLFVVLWASV